MRNQIAPLCLAILSLAAAAPAAEIAFDSPSDAPTPLTLAREAAAQTPAPAGVSEEVVDALSRCEPGTTSRYSYEGGDALLGEVKTRDGKTVAVSGEVAVTSCSHGAFGRGTLKGLITAELDREFAKPGDEGDGDVFGTVRLEDAHGRHVGDLAIKGHAWGRMECQVFGWRGGGGQSCYLRGHVTVWTEEFRAPGK